MTQAAPQISAPFGTSDKAADWFEESYRRADKDNTVITGGNDTQILPLVALPDMHLRLRGVEAHWNPRILNEFLQGTTSLVQVPMVPQARGMDSHYLIARPSHDWRMDNATIPVQFRRDPLLAVTRFEPGYEAGQGAHALRDPFHPRHDKDRWHGRARNLVEEYVHDLRQEYQGVLRFLDMMLAADDAVLVEYFQACHALLADGFPVDFQGENYKFVFAPDSSGGLPRLQALRQYDNGTPEGEFSKTHALDTSQYASGAKFVSLIRRSLDIDDIQYYLNPALRMRLNGIEDKARRCMDIADYPYSSKAAYQLMREGEQAAARRRKTFHEEPIYVQAPGSANHAYQILRERMQAADAAKAGLVLG